MPSSRRSAPRKASYAATAAAASPARASRRIRARGASSEAGSRSSRRRACWTAALASPGPLGRVAERREEVTDPVAVRLALLEHPVVVEVGQEVAVGERQGLVRPAFGDETPDLPNVNPDVGAVLDADAVAAGDDVAGGVRPHAPSQRRQGGPEAGPRAGLEHVGPEDRRDTRAWVQPGVVGQPRQQRPCPAAGGGVEPLPVELEAELADEAYAQHPHQAYPEDLVA